MTILTRRSILRGLFAMPAVVAASSLMPVRGWIMPIRMFDPSMFKTAFVDPSAWSPLIIPSHIVEAIGEGNHAAGTLILNRIFNRPQLTPDTTPPSADGA